MDMDSYINSMFAEPRFGDLLKQAKERATNLARLVDEVFVSGKHYGSATGGHDGKKTLLKPGAEVALAFFNLVPTYEVTTVRGNGEEEPAFSCSVLCEAHVGDTKGPVVGEGVGAGNTHETKFRYKKDERGTRIKNPDAYGAQNTVLKFSKKRALVDCALGTIPGLSCIFTQDMEPEETGGADDFLGKEKVEKPNITSAAQVFKATGNVKEDGEALAKMIAQAKGTSPAEIVRQVTKITREGKVYQRDTFATIANATWEMSAFDKLNILAGEVGIAVVSGEAKQ